MSATGTLDSKQERTIAGIVLALAAIKLALHLYADRYYGYFVDELYYLACSHHLDWGYVDQPPLIAAVTWLVRGTLGDSLSAIRLLPALAGAAEVWMAGLLAREFGGGKFAQGLAALSVLTATALLVVDNFLSMNAWEPLLWMGCAWIGVRIVKTGNPKLWLRFGALAGIGLQNKYSMALFCGGLIFGLLLTTERRILWTPWLIAGGALAAVIFLPNLLWNVAHHFPFLELQENIKRSGRDVALNPLAFFAQEALTLNPLTAPVWIGGLWFFFTKAGKPFRWLGCAWLFTAAVIAAMSPRIYYLYPAFPLVCAGGGVLWEKILAGQPAWRKFALPALIAVCGAVLAPMMLPLLPPETWIKYSQALHLSPPRIENHKDGPLPQLFADQFGWPEMAAEVARIYNSLPPEQRADTAIFGQNYGEAGAVDFFGPRYGLPPAISGHQNYYLWGPRNYTGARMIVMDDREERLRELFTTVRKAGHVEHPYSLPYRHFDVYYCEGLKMPMAELWKHVKQWD